MDFVRVDLSSSSPLCINLSLDRSLSRFLLRLSLGRHGTLNLQHLHRIQGNLVRLRASQEGTQTSQLSQDPTCLLLFVEGQFLHRAT